MSIPDEVIRTKKILELCEGSCENGFIGLIDALETFSVNVFLMMEREKGSKFAKEARDYWATHMNNRFSIMMDVIYDDELFENISGIFNDHMDKQEENERTGEDGFVYHIVEDEP